MDTKRRWIAFIFVIMLLADLPSLIFANDFEDQKLSLKGLKEIGVCVILTSYSSSDRQGWEAKFGDQLTKEIGMRLRKEGIKVPSENEEIKSAGLWIDISVEKTGPNRYLCRGEPRLWRKVYLERTPTAKPFHGFTYGFSSLSHAYHHSVPADEEKYIRNFVNEIADWFIKEYRSVNPKQEVILRGMRYRIFDSYWSDYLYLGKHDQGPLQKAKARFLVIDFSITNMEKETRDKDLAPVFTLTDERGSEYESVKPDTPVETLISKLLTQPMDPNVEIKGKLIFDVPPGQRYKLSVSSPIRAEVSTAPAEVSGESFSFDLTPLPKPLGTVGMIGIRLNEDGVIKEVIDGGPAFESGLKAGDKIIKVNGQPVAAGDITMTQEITGDASTTVELTVLRSDIELLFKIERKILGIE